MKARVTIFFGAERGEYAPFSLRKSRVASFLESTRRIGSKLVPLDKDVFNVRQRERRRDRYFCLGLLTILS
jgi:hypothetical protein